MKPATGSPKCAQELRRGASGQSGLSETGKAGIQTTLDAEKVLSWWERLLYGLCYWCIDISRDEALREVRSRAPMRPSLFIHCVDVDYRDYAQQQRNGDDLALSLSPFSQRTYYYSGHCSVLLSLVTNGQLCKVE